MRPVRSTLLRSGCNGADRRLSLAPGSRNGRRHRRQRLGECRHCLPLRLALGSGLTKRVLSPDRHRHEPDEQGQPGKRYRDIDEH